MSKDKIIDLERGADGVYRPVGAPRVNRAAKPKTKTPKTHRQPQAVTQPTMQYTSPIDEVIRGIEFGTRILTVLKKVSGG